MSEINQLDSIYEHIKRLLSSRRPKSSQSVCRVDPISKMFSEISKPPNPQQLLKASKLGDAVEVQKLLAQGANVFHKDSGGNTALHQAASKNHEAIITMLLNSGAYIDALDHNGCTPLHCAAKHGHGNVLRQLMTAGSKSIDKPDHDGDTPLHKAACFGHSNVVQILLDAGALVNQIDKNGAGAIHKAAYNGHSDVIQVLLNAQVSIDLLDKDKYSALHLAALRGYDIVVKVLLTSGASVDLTDETHQTPLHKAAFCGFDNIVEILLIAGASAVIKDKDGKDPLELAKSNNHMSTAALIDKFLDIFVSDTQQDFVSKSGKIHDTLEASPVPQTTTESGSGSPKKSRGMPKALKQAIKKGDMKAVRQHLNDGIDPNSTNEKGNTLLHVAIIADQENVVHTLLNISGVNLKLCNNEGLTPLVMAIKLGHRRLAREIYSKSRNNDIDVPTDAIIIDYSKSLGAGAFGCVFQGSFNDEIVAVKTAHKGCEQALTEEMSTMMKCRSPYIVDIVAKSSEDDEHLKLVLQYMDCGDLRQYLNAKRDGKPTTISVTPLEVAWVVANALADLHHDGFIHRDLKSNNILLSTKHYIKLADMGVSRELTEGTMTQVGTTLWEAPEVLRGEHYSYSADIYSFGVILTELDTLQVPYASLQLNNTVIKERVQSGSLQPSLSPKCQPWLKSLAEKCLSFDANKRPSAQDAVEILRSQIQTQGQSKLRQLFTRLGSSKSVVREKTRKFTRSMSCFEVQKSSRVPEFQPSTNTGASRRTSFQSHFMTQ